MLASFPFKEHFAGGLLFSAFNAATIGGLADSFAVGALFGNPLRIKWPAFMGTRVIERNRSRLIHELGHMVQHELLTTDHINARLQEYSISAILIKYLREHGGQQHITEIAERLAGELASRTDEHELAKVLQDLLFSNAEVFQLADLAADLADWTIRNGYDEYIIHFLLSELIRVVESERFRLILEQLVSSALASYEQGKFRRQFVNLAAGLEPEALSGKIQAKIADFLREMQVPDHPERVKLKLKMEQYILNLRYDPDWRAAIEQSKNKLLLALKEHVRLDPFVRGMLDALLHTSPEIMQQQEGGRPVLSSWLGRKVDQTISRFESDTKLLDSFDRAVRGVLLQWIEQKHSFIAKVVTDKLNTYSQEELVAMVRDKAGKDLQYIRLNGLVIGGLVGVLLYLVSFVVGGLSR
ncbi:membrane protein [Paenibacillus physcomitrellae]|uniref:Membrane protein n=2 Tax=Paenibacillus physcomitrellae TaxID=1619311 RepID=A0ABQ1GCT2_9BACL|nr:membrane protein [Paenibacillus physcomitrellae]